jgi:hypothetical protein
MIVNGKLVLDSEIWQNTLTPAEAAAMERAYQAQRLETRRRIDTKFTRSASPQKIYRNQQGPVTHKTDLRKRAFAEQTELLELQLKQKRLLHLILE